MIIRLLKLGCPRDFSIQSGKVGPCTDLKMLNSMMVKLGVVCDCHIVFNMKDYDWCSLSFIILQQANHQEAEWWTKTSGPIQFDSGCIIFTIMYIYIIIYI